MYFLLHLVGFVVFVAGLALIATAVGLSETWINVVAAILLALGVFTAFAQTRARDTP